MKYAVVVTLLLLNCGLFFVASILTIPGDGSDAHMELKWAIGFGWIAIVHLASLVLVTKGRGGMAIGLAGLTLPVGIAAIVIATAAIGLYDSYKPDSPEFKTTCQATGVAYIRKPSKPVRSIAYDWPTDAYPPSYSLTKIDGRRNIITQSGGLPSFPMQIEFIEIRGGRFEGPPSNGIGPFVRHPRVGAYYGISELSADALVTFQTMEKPGVDSKSDVRLWQISVLDRRDNQLLAELRYAIDSRNKRSCGETSPGEINERAFVVRALDVR